MRVNLRNFDDQIVNLLLQNKTYKQIGDELNLNPESVRKYTERNYNNLLKVKRMRGNTSYFHTIDTKAKAYLLGFITADGSIVKSGNTQYLTITLKYEDREVLEFLKAELQDNRQLLEISRPSSFDSTKIIHHIRFSIGSNEIAGDLLQYGITPNKSLSMGNIIYNIPYELRDAFIVGYFDGDGSVSHVSHSPNNKSLSMNIRGTYPFLQGICQHLQIPTSYIKQYDSIPQLVITNKNYISRFFQCYNGLPFFYKRKYDKFIGWNTPDKRYKQVQTISSSQ